MMKVLPPGNELLRDRHDLDSDTLQMLLEYYGEDVTEDEIYRSPHGAILHYANQSRFSKAIADDVIRRAQQR